MYDDHSVKSVLFSADIQGKWLLGTNTLNPVIGKRRAIISSELIIQHLLQTAMLWAADLTNNSNVRKLNFHWEWFYLLQQLSELFGSSVSGAHRLLWSHHRANTSSFRVLSRAVDLPSLLRGRRTHLNKTTSIREICLNLLQATCRFPFSWTKFRLKRS